MRPSGALVLAALGLALMQPGKDSRVAFAVGLAVIAVAALGLSLVLFNVDLDIISPWLAPWAAVPGLGPAVFRVAVATVLAFGSRADRSRSAVSKGIASLRPCSPASPAP